MGKYIFIGVALMMCVLGAYYFYTQYPYSEGNRAGLLVKFSKKGYVFKTYEGQLNTGGVAADPKAGLVNAIWDFSVLDHAVADSLMHLEGKYLRLHYRQIIKNWAWQGETTYFVDGVDLVNK